MSFFQNPFTYEFIGVWVLGDRQHSPDFKCPRNAGRTDEFVVTHNAGNYNLSGNDADGNSNAVLTIVWALNDKKNWSELAISVAGSTPAATTATEIITLLNANATFADYFTASSHTLNNGGSGVAIKQKKSISQFWFYIKNARAEAVLGFNKLAGIAELPSFFARHTIANRFTYTDSQNNLIALSTSTATEAALINNAVDEKGVSRGYSSSTVKADYELLRGRSGIFMMYKHTVDGSNRITQTIEYPAGALAGDMAKKTTFSYTSSNTSPDKKAEVPYVLQSGDIVTP